MYISNICSSTNFRCGNTCIVYIILFSLFLNNMPIEIHMFPLYIFMQNHIFLMSIFTWKLNFNQYIRRTYDYTAWWRRQWGPLQSSCLENPRDRGAWWAAVHGVANSRTQLSDFTFPFHFHALEKEMTTHSSVLAWRTPGTGEPGGLPSMGRTESETNEVT